MILCNRPSKQARPGPLFLDEGEEPDNLTGLGRIPKPKPPSSDGGNSPLSSNNKFSDSPINSSDNSETPISPDQDSENKPGIFDKLANLFSFSGGHQPTSACTGAEITTPNSHPIEEGASTSADQSIWEILFGKNHSDLPYYPDDMQSSIHAMGDGGFSATDQFMRQLDCGGSGDFGFGPPPSPDS